MRIETECCEGIERYNRKCLKDRCPEYQTARDEIGKNWPYTGTGFGNLHGEPTHEMYLYRVRERAASDYVASLPENRICDGPEGIVVRLSGQPGIYETENEQLKVDYEERSQLNGGIQKLAILQSDLLKPKYREGKTTRDGLRKVCLRSLITPYGEYEYGRQPISKYASLVVYIEVQRYRAQG